MMMGGGMDERRGDWAVACQLLLACMLRSILRSSDYTRADRHIPSTNSPIQL